MTKSEAAEHLRYESPQALDRRLIESEKYTPDKLRCRRVERGAARARVLIWRDDVLKLAPDFETPDEPTPEGIMPPAEYIRRLELADRTRRTN